MSRRLGKVTKREAPAIRLDDNVVSYDVQRDGRSGEGRISLMRLDRIEASPFQVRRVFPEREIEELAESIRKNGLIHEPRGRPHPTRAGWVELMPGEMRLRALKRLVEMGEAETVLTRDGEGNWLVPIKVDAIDDARAEAIVLSENMDRTDLSAWEWALAWQQRRESLKGRGEAATVRDIAASLGKKYQTVGEYLRVADAITQKILLSAGVVSDGEADHKRMALLSLAALQRVVRAAASGASTAAERLLQELKRAGDSVAATQLEERKQAARRLRRPEHSGFQLNIRQALRDVPPRQAMAYLERLAPAVSVLSSRVAGQAEVEEAEAIARAFERAAQQLRSPTS